MDIQNFRVMQNYKRRHDYLQSITKKQNSTILALRKKFENIMKLSSQQKKAEQLRLRRKLSLIYTRKLPLTKSKPATPQSVTSKHGWLQRPINPQLPIRTQELQQRRSKMIMIGNEFSKYNFQVRPRFSRTRSSISVDQQLSKLQIWNRTKELGNSYSIIYRRNTPTRNYVTQNMISKYETWNFARQMGNHYSLMYRNTKPPEQYRISFPGKPQSARSALAVKTSNWQRARQMGTFYTARFSAIQKKPKTTEEKLKDLIAEKNELEMEMNGTTGEPSRQSIKRYDEILEQLRVLGEKLYEENNEAEADPTWLPLKLVKSNAEFKEKCFSALKTPCTLMTNVSGSKISLSRLSGSMSISKILEATEAVAESVSAILKSPEHNSVVQNTGLRVTSSLNIHPKSSTSLKTAHSKIFEETDEKDEKETVLVPNPSLVDITAGNFVTSTSEKTAHSKIYDETDQKIQEVLIETESALVTDPPLVDICPDSSITEDNEEKKDDSLVDTKRTESVSILKKKFSSIDSTATDLQTDADFANRYFISRNQKHVIYSDNSDL